MPLELKSIETIKKELSEISKWYSKSIGWFENFKKTILSAKSKLSIKDIGSQFGLLKEAQEKLESLSYLLSSLRSDYSGFKESRKMLSEGESLYARINKEVEAAWSNLSKTAQKGAPSKFIKISEQLVKAMTEKFKGRYKTMWSDYQIAPVKEELHVVCYICFEKLKDDSEYVHPNYYILLTQVIDKTGKEAGLYVNVWSANSIPLPGRYRLAMDVSFDINDIEKSVDHLLSGERMLSVMKPYVIPEIKLLHKDVQKVFVKDNIINIKLKSSVGKDVEKVGFDVIKNIKLGVGPRMYKQLVFRARIVRNQKLVQLIVQRHPDSELYIQPNQWEMVREILNISPEDLRRLQQIL